MEDSLVQKRFLWGLLVSWAPWIPTLIGAAYLFAGSKATGVAAVAGGMLELLVLWGMVTMIVSQIAAIVWLARSFSGAHIIRSLFAAASIVASGLMVFFVFAYLFWGRHVLSYTPLR